MPLRRRLAAGLIASTLLLFPVLSHTQSQTAEKPEGQAETPVYNGDWWLTLGGWEQYGVVTGYEDCYTSEYRGSVAFEKEAQTYIDDLNKYFLSDVSLRKQPVSEALDAMRKSASDQSSPATPDSAKSAHGEYDGKFWFDADPAAELGFVEGYLACHSAKLKDADAKFSKAPSEYVDLINKAYNITDDTDDVDADKAPWKIADVLHKLKDADSAAPKPAR